jgi:hypothetical protein
MRRYISSIFPQHADRFANLRMACCPNRCNWCEFPDFITPLRSSALQVPSPHPSAKFAACTSGSPSASGSWFWHRT